MASLLRVRTWLRWVREETGEAEPTVWVFKSDQGGEFSACDLRDWLAERGYDRNYGARPLARVVQEHIKKPLADMLLFGDLAGGGLALVDAKDGKITVTGKPTPQRALPGKRTALPAPEEQ